MAVVVEGSDGGGGGGGGGGAPVVLGAAGRWQVWVVARVLGHLEEGEGGGQGLPNHHWHIMQDGSSVLEFIHIAYMGEGGLHVWHRFFNAQSVLINKISASEFSRKLKCAVGWVVWFGVDSWIYCTIQKKN